MRLPAQGGPTPGVLARSGTAREVLSDRQLLVLGVGLFGLAALLPAILLALFDLLAPLNGASLTVLGSACLDLQLGHDEHVLIERQGTGWRPG